MFVPFIFSLDTNSESESYFHWRQFFKYADGCIANKWPIISHERYFARFSHVEEKIFGIPLAWIVSGYYMHSIPTTEEMLALKTYPVLQAKEDALVAKFASQFDCWIELLRNENAEFEQIIGELLDRITDDFGEKPEGVLCYEYLPKSLLSAANKRGIPLIFQGGGVLRPPFASSMNAFSLINDNSGELVQSRYNHFMAEDASVPMLTAKGLLRLFIAEKYISDIHNIDKEPEYDVGVLHNNLKTALYHVGEEFVADQDLSARAKAVYDKVLVRTRPGFEPVEDACDDSPTCFHFCCKCKRVLGFTTKAMFEAMIARRIAHESGSFIFHGFSNNGIEDDSKGIAPVEFLNFVLFGLCTPMAWLTDPEYLRLLLSNPSEKELYMRSFRYYTQGISKEDLEIYYMSDNRAYRLGDMLFFTSGHKPYEYAAYYNLGGLCPIGDTYTWSNGDSTSFEFDLTGPVNEPLTISVVLYDVAMDWKSPNPTQTVTCMANGEDCGSVTLTPGKKYLSFTIPADCIKDKLQVSFGYSYLHPNENLKLAVAFKGMHISRTGQMLIEDEMTSENAALSHRISDLEAYNAGLIAQISMLEAQCANQNSHIAGLEAQSANQNSQIAGLQAQSANQNAQITGLQAQCANQNSQIAALQALNAEQSLQTSGLIAQVAEKSAQMSGLIAHIAEQSEQISGMIAHITEQGMQISGLEVRNSEQKEHISVLEAKNTEQYTQISGLEAQNAEQKAYISGLEAQIQTIYGSRSWKIGHGIIKTTAAIIPRKK